MNGIYRKLREGFFFEWSLVIVAFCFPLYSKLLTIAIVSSVLLFLLKEDLLARVISVFKNRIFILLLLFYFLHIVSFFLSDDKEYAAKDLETKLSLILFPLLFFGSGGFNYTKREWIEKSFLFGILFSIVLCIYYAIVQSFNNPYSDGSFNISIWADMLDKNWLWLLLTGNSFFNYDSYSHFIHPSYFAVYLTFATFLMTRKDKFGQYLMPNKIIRNTLAFLLIFNVFLLQSRAGLLGIFVYTIWILVVASKKTKISVMYIFLILLISLAILFNGRFERLTSSFSNFSWENLKKTEIRFSIWNESFQLISTKPIFGHGIGDAKFELIKQYEKNNLTIAAENKLNAHNEFLEILIQLGFIGLLIFLAILLYPMHIFESKVDMWIYLFFLTLITLHLIFESMFERIAGISFIMYFYSYLNTRNFKI